MTILGSPKVLIIMSDFKSKVRTFTSHRKKLFQKNISGNMKYVVVSVAAKMLVKFWRTTTEISKNRSKFMKNAFFHLFWWPFHKSFSASQLLVRFCRENLDASNMLQDHKNPISLKKISTKNHKYYSFECREPKVKQFNFLA